MSIYVRSLGKICVDAYEACEWFQSLPISKSPNNRLEQINNYISYKLLNPATPEGESFEHGIADIDTYYVLSDGAGFGLIAKEMKKLSPQLCPKGTLRDILQGSLKPSDETTNDSDARNKFVELELAAHLSKAGFKLLGFDDLKFEIEGIEYQVQCKRPSNIRTLDSNIERAYQQLEARLHQNDSRGIIAIAVEKIFDLDQGFQSMLSSSDISEFGKQIGQKFKTKVDKFNSQWVDTRVVGILAIIRFLFRIEGTQEVGASYNCGLIMFASFKFAQEADEQRLLRMVSQLQSG